MADPFSAGILGITALSSVSQVRGQDKAAAAAIQASVFNAQIEKQRGIAQESLIRKQSDSARSRNIALISKSGATSEGSPMEALLVSASAAETDALNARFNSLASQRLDLLQAKSQQRAARTSRASGILTGAASTLTTGRRLGVF